MVNKMDFRNKVLELSESKYDYTNINKIHLESAKKNWKEFYIYNNTSNKFPKLYSELSENELEELMGKECYFHEYSDNLVYEDMGDGTYYLEVE